ncbi:hypothetical protein D3C75_964470 [compost metagenome]
MITARNGSTAKAINDSFTESCSIMARMPTITITSFTRLTNTWEYSWFRASVSWVTRTTRRPTGLRSKKDMDIRERWLNSCCRMLKIICCPVYCSRLLCQ